MLKYVLEEEVFRFYFAESMEVQILSASLHEGEVPGASLVETPGSFSALELLNKILIMDTEGRPDDKTQNQKVIKHQLLYQDFTGSYAVRPNANSWGGDWGVFFSNFSWQNPVFKINRDKKIEKPACWKNGAQLHT